LVLLSLVFGSVTGQELAPEQKYSFSADWFSLNIPVWEKVFGPYKGREGLRYLEIGVFEGRSLLWMLDNVLTHPTARATGIDIFTGGTKGVFLKNLLLSGAENRVEVVTGRSRVELLRLEPDWFDIIYVDGSHLGADVLTDAVLSWRLLKDEGLLVFDDYYHKRKDVPAELRPQAAIDAFVTVFRNSLEVVHSGRQRVFRKRPREAFRLILGQYEYDWQEKNLYAAGEKELVPLSDKEKEFVGRLFMGRKFGEVRFSPPPDVLADPDFVKLRERLKLDPGVFAE
jgi:hypothetical protein